MIIVTITTRLINIYTYIYKYNITNLNPYSREELVVHSLTYFQYILDKPPIYSSYNSEITQIITS